MECCQRRDLPAEAREAHRARLRAAAGRPWQVEVLPLPTTTVDEVVPARPVVALVVADDVVLREFDLPNLEGGAGAAAEALDQGIRKTAEELGIWPDSVHVRHREIQATLSRLLNAAGIDVRCRNLLPTLENAAARLLADRGCAPHWPPLGRLVGWQGWGLPRPLVAELLEAAATFWEEAPWHAILDVQSPRCTLPSGRECSCAVLGSGGEEIGLALHSKHVDASERPGLDDPDSRFEGIWGQMLVLLFEPPDEVPGAALEESAELGWRVTESDAYPSLRTVNTPGGGITEEEARDLVLLLRAMPRFVHHHRSTLQLEWMNLEPAKLEWIDPETGVAFRYEGEAVERELRLDPPEVAAIQIDTAITLELSEVLHELSTLERSEDQDRKGRGRSDRRSPTSGSARREVNRPRSGIRAKMARDLRQLKSLPREALGGLSHSELLSLIWSDWGLKDQEANGVLLRNDLTRSDLAGVPAHEGIRALLELAEETDGLECTAAGTLGSAVVNRWVDRVADRVPEWAGLGDSLRAGSRERQVPVLHWLRVLAELHRCLVPVKDRLFLGPWSRRLLKPEQDGVLYAELFRVCFQDYNLGYGLPFAWPAGQDQAAFTLYRLGQVALGWMTPGELLLHRTVLQSAEENLHMAPSGSADEIFENHLLRPLVRFGLLERRSSDREPLSFLYRVAPRYIRFLEFRVASGVAWLSQGSSR